MTLLYYDAIFQAHQTGNHPEHPRRLEAVARHLQWVGLDAICRRPPWEPISREQLLLVHTADHIEHVQATSGGSGGWIEHDTFVCGRSYEVALMAAGAVCDAVARVVRGEDTTALCLVRPPGHHALPDQVMGFCLFNNIALAAQVATCQLDLDRVLVVDWDVHHGNGTQAAFWENDRVGFFSIHRYPFYPGSGAADETGGGPGLGATVNLPIEWGTSQREYLQKFEYALANMAASMRPQLILLSAGFDAHRDDPIGSLGLDTQDFRQLTKISLQVAAEYCDGRIVSVLEGGYDPGTLADCIDGHLEELLG